MNYLAHARLSFNDPPVLVGNMISDFVKGKKKFDYPSPILAGITLHRLIDNFTDDHPATKKAREFFHPYYRLYSGAFVDVVYDHFLARDTGEFPGNSLLTFSEGVYAHLESQQSWLPQPFSNMFQHMRSQNWLYHYHTRKGTEQSFGGVVRRAVYLQESDAAVKVFNEHYQPLEECYRQFWSDVKRFAMRQFEILRN
jgi:acyl carrier protein phosphodiesterase